MRVEHGHPNVTLEDWQGFSAWQKSLKEFPASLIGEVIDRNETQLPDWFVPLARGVAVASDSLLGAPADFVSNSPVPSSWRPAGGNVFKWDVAGVCGWYVQGFGDLWIPGRWSLRQGERVLVHQFGATPIVTRHCRTAMWLSVGCRAFHELCWIKACPTNRDAAIEFTRKRQTDEARGASREQLR